MAIQARITPVCAGECDCLSKPHIGPVTVAIRAVRHRGNPASDVLAAQHWEERRALEGLRLRIASHFAADADLLERAGA